jgi:hypothetical protein
VSDTAAGPGPLRLRDRLGTVLSKFRFFLVSYAPLALIFSFRSFPHAWVASSVWFVLAAWGFIDGWRLVHGALRRNVRSVTLTEVRDAGGAVAAYLASYLLPFISSSPKRAAEVAGYIVYFLVVLVIFLRSELRLVNPTLYLLGWRVFEGRSDGRNPATVVCKNPPESGERIDVVEFLGAWVRKDG